MEHRGLYSTASPFIQRWQLHAFTHRTPSHKECRQLRAQSSTHSAGSSFTPVSSNAFSNLQHLLRAADSSLRQSQLQTLVQVGEQKNNSGLGLGIACTQRINSGRWSNAYIACDSTGRLMEQSGNGLASRMPEMSRNAAGVMAGRPALIPLVGNNSQFNILFTTKTLIYRLQWGGWEPAFSPSRETIQIPI